MGKTSWQATRQNQIKVLKMLFMPSCLWVEARDEQTRFENCVRIAKSPSSLCPRKSRPATERERERARARKGTEDRGSWHKASSLCCWSWWSFCWYHAATGRATATATATTIDRVIVRARPESESESGSAKAQAEAEEETKTEAEAG